MCLELHMKELITRYQYTLTTVTDDKAEGHGVPLRLTYPKEFWCILVSEIKYAII